MTKVKPRLTPEAGALAAIPIDMQAAHFFNQTPRIASSMVRNLFLAIDVGTGGIRSALVDHDGEILKICHKEHEQIVPRYGWSEQRPADWWAGTIETINQVLTEVDDAPARVAAICACGQMHGAVLVDSKGS